MKRDMDLIRRILLDIEDDDGSFGNIGIKYDDVMNHVLNYHFGLLVDARYIIAMKFAADNVVTYIPTSITWEGHEFLDSIRNESVWKNIKSKLTDELSSVPLKVLAAVGAALTQEYLKKKLGLK